MEISYRKPGDEISYGVGLKNLRPLDTRISTADKEGIVSQQNAFTIVDLSKESSSPILVDNCENIVITGFHIYGLGKWRYKFLHWLATRFAHHGGLW